MEDKRCRGGALVLALFPNVVLNSSHPLSRCCADLVLHLQVYGYVPQYASECDNSTIAMCHDADGSAFSSPFSFRPACTLLPIPRIFSGILLVATAMKAHLLLLPMLTFCSLLLPSVSFMRGSFTFEAGVYNTVTEVAIINSDTEEANGVIALYFGETLAFQLMDVVLRINESVEFSSFIFSCTSRVSSLRSRRGSARF